MPARCVVRNNMAADLRSPAARVNLGGHACDAGMSTTKIG
jgi:hypothetical protein